MRKKAKKKKKIGEKFHIEEKQKVEMQLSFIQLEYITNLESKQNIFL